MATSTQPIGQSLFDFLDGKSSFEKLEALRSGELGQEINRYVQTQLDRFHIGSLQNSIQDSIWASQGWRSGATPEFPSRPMAFRSNSAEINQSVDLVGDAYTRVTGPEDLQAGLGGIDEGISGTEHPTEAIFKSHRNA